MFTLVMAGVLVRVPSIALEKTNYFTWCSFLGITNSMSCKFLLYNSCPFLCLVLYRNVCFVVAFQQYLLHWPTQSQKSPSVCLRIDVANSHCALHIHAYAAYQSLFLINFMLYFRLSVNNGRVADLF